MTLRKGEDVMMDDQFEKLEERIVTYTLQINGQLCVIENVPARVNEETGEKFFSPDTVERIQHLIRNQKTPARVTEVPVYNYAA